MRALPAVVALVAAIVAPLVSAGCYSVPALEDAGAAEAGADGTGHNPDSSSGSDGSGGSSSGSGSSNSSSGGSSSGHTDGSAPDASCTGGILCACGNANDCTTATAKICATSGTVGMPIIQAAGVSGFCTRPCCVSSDCPSGTVCYASGEGGQYCVDPTWLGRAKPTSNRSGGAACTSSSDCLSGLCVGGMCADTCCSYTESSVECPGAKCVFGTFPGKPGIDTHFAPHCAPLSGNTQTGNPCGQNGDCQGGLCYNFGGAMGSDCTEPCRASSDCGTADSVCSWDVLGGSGTDVYAACFPLGTLGNFGASCMNDMQCGTGVCNTANCTGPCFGDGDCSGVSGWRCTPAITLTFSVGAYPVLSCGP